MATVVIYDEFGHAIELDCSELQRRYVELHGFPNDIEKLNFLKQLSPEPFTKKGTSDITARPVEMGEPTLTEVPRES